MLCLQGQKDQRAEGARKGKEASIVPPSPKSEVPQSRIMATGAAAESQLHHYCHSQEQDKASIPVLWLTGVEQI